MDSLQPDPRVHGVRVAIACVVLFCLSGGLLAQELSVGDKVEFEFMGETRRGVITRFTGTGWPFVKFQYRGREREIPRPGDDVRVISPAKALKAMPTARARNWSSRNGKSTVKAVLDSIEGDKVRLKKEDGKVVAVPIEKLSDKDQGYIDAMRDALESSEDEEGLFDGGVPDNDDRTGTTGTADGEFDPDSLPVGSVNSAEVVALRPKSNWPLDPDIAPASSPQSGQVIRVARQETSHHPIHDSFAYGISHDGRRVAIGVANAFGDRTSVQLIDLTSGQVDAKGSLPKKMQVLGISDDGKKIATGRAPHSRLPDHVALWEPVDGALKPAGGWKRSGRAGFETPALRFIAEDRLLLTSGEAAAIWDWATPKAIAGYSIRRRTGVALSGNRQQMAMVGADGNVYITSASSGKLLTSIDSPDESISQLAFSPNGQKLAGYGRGHLIVWDLQDGTQMAETWLLRSPAAGSLAWADDQFVLVGGSSLVDTRSGVTAWYYRSAEFIAKGKGSQFWALHWEENGGNLIPFTLPPRSVVDACAEVEPDQLEWIEPGPASLVIESLGGLDSEVRQKLTERLTQNGYRIEHGAKLAIRVWLERGKTQTEGVRDWFRGPFGEANETITFTPSKGKYEVTYNGQVIAAGTSREFTVPHTLRLGENETAQQAANRYCRPNVEFFNAVWVPRKGPLLPGGKESFGASDLAADGW